MESLPNYPAGDLATTLAVKYRPHKFSELSGQRHVIKILKSAIRDRKVPQQILFSGGSGIGKTTIARVLASSLLCTTAQDKREDFEPCGSCSSCILIADPRQLHPDLIEFDAASNGGKDEIRDIANKAQYSPVLSEIKVYIIDEAHGLSGPGGQAFLKLLEEPPAHVIFMLCTTDPEKMLKTNRGRCVEFQLFRPTTEESLTNLRRIVSAEGWVIGDYYLKEIVNASDPELGVRGQVTNLAKLSGILSIGESIDEDVLAHLLGTISRNKIRLLFKAIHERNPLHALDILSQIRTQTDESFLRLSLIQYARELWLESLANAADSGFNYEIYRKLVSMPAEEGWMELTIAQVSRPELAPTEVSASDFQSYSNSMLNNLNQAITQGSRLLEELEAKISSNSDPTPSKPKRKNKSESSASATRVGPGKVNKNEVKPTLFDDDNSNDVVKLIMACMPAPIEVSSILNKCEVTFSESTCRILVPSNLKEVFADINEYVLKGAQRLGMELDSAFVSN